MSQALEKGDLIARCLIYPQLFMGNIQASSKLWEFGQRSADGGSHLSGVLRRLAPNDNDVHRFGCKIAATQNAAMLARLELTSLPLEKRRYYCGFKEASVEKLAVTTENYHITLTLAPEFGEDSHVDVALYIKESVPRNRHANLRTDAGIALAETFSETVPHICTVDVDDKDHPIERLGIECLGGELPGPWQGKTFRLPSEAVDAGSELVGNFQNVFGATNVPVITGRLPGTEASDS